MRVLSGREKGKKMYGEEEGGGKEKRRKKELKGGRGEGEQKQTNF